MVTTGLGLTLVGVSHLSHACLAIVVYIFFRSISSDINGARFVWMQAKEQDSRKVGANTLCTKFLKSSGK
jgi:hypothetical protein